MASERMVSREERPAAPRLLDRAMLCMAVLVALFLLAWIQPPMLNIAHALFSASRSGGIAWFSLDLTPQFNGMLFGVASIVFALPLLVMAVADILPRTQVLLLLCATSVLAVFSGGFVLLYGRNFLLALLIAVATFVAVALPLAVTLGALRAVQALMARMRATPGVRSPETLSEHLDA